MRFAEFLREATASPFQPAQVDQDRALPSEASGDDGSPRSDQAVVREDAQA